MRIKIDIKDRASATVRAIADGLKDRTGLHKVLGKRLEQEVQKHFKGREREPNKKNWPKQNFWSRMRNATAFLSADKEGATVRISDPAIASKVWGATITPKETKYLSIPAIAEAYGKSPKLNKNLEPMVRRMGGGLRPRAVALQDKDTKTIWYWLVKSVTVPKDPDALPDEGELQNALFEQAGKYLARLEKEAQKKSPRNSK